MKSTTPSIEVVKYNLRAQVLESKWANDLQEAADILRNWQMTVRTVHDIPSNREGHIGMVWQYGAEITSMAAEILAKK